MGRGVHRGFITHEELFKSLGKRNLSQDNLSQAFIHILDEKIFLVEQKSDFKALKKKDKKLYKSQCRAIREDGPYVEAGENDNLIIEKLVADPGALGVFGYSFLDQNKDKVKAANVDGVSPEFEAISSGKYPVSRSLFFYVKNAHAAVIPGIKQYVREFTSSKAIGSDGYLISKGLIPLPQSEREKFEKDGKILAKFDEKILKK